jgi:hypothetical protein
MHQLQRAIVRGLTSEDQGVIRQTIFNGTLDLLGILADAQRSRGIASLDIASQCFSVFGSHFVELCRQEIGPRQGSKSAIVEVLYMAVALDIVGVGIDPLSIMPVLMVNSDEEYQVRLSHARTLSRSDGQGLAIQHRAGFALDELEEFFGSSATVAFRKGILQVSVGGKRMEMAVMLVARQEDVADLSPDELVEDLKS